MISKVFSCAFTGLDCQTIEVQADISSGMPSFNIVGLGDTSVHESRERVKSSIKNCGLLFPQNRKTINLSPAKLRKHGTHFDLPIAISMLLASQQIPPEDFNDAIFVGELSLTGKIKPIEGSLLIAQHAKEEGFKRIFLPQANAVEAGFIEGIEIYPLEDLQEFIKYAQNKHLKPKTSTKIQPENCRDYRTFNNILGLSVAKRALQVAAAGGHNVLFQGPPGCGKTLLCRAFHCLLPEMTIDEILQTSKIFSIAGKTDEKNPLIKERPFREVHPTGSLVSLIGGGNPPKPGEISLANNGVLFLDEIAEFQSKMLESLRQPLEDRKIIITRQNHATVFPANFILLATMNPCSCGFFGDEKIRCICSESNIRNYEKRISGPLKDRFDIILKINRSPMGQIFNKGNEIPGHIRAKSIDHAQKAQLTRFFHHPDIQKNADMQLAHIRKFCLLNEQNKKTLDDLAVQKHLSNRAYLKIIKLARTIADLEKSEEIQKHHLMEAVQFRAN
ncbi:YifB family Mg chelatase-like AAA ATPase [Candidatus Peregrinibacteria bacterium]|nr:YifB family Mg chelatase-like AAA ATPase [Candidatus Peregrinibacteria bacterium]